MSSDLSWIEEELERIHHNLTLSIPLFDKLSYELIDTTDCVLEIIRGENRVPKEVDCALKRASVYLESCVHWIDQTDTKAKRDLHERLTLYKTKEAWYLNHTQQLVTILYELRSWILRTYDFCERNGILTLKLRIGYEREIGLLLLTKRTELERKLNQLEKEQQYLTYLSKKEGDGKYRERIEQIKDCKLSLVSISEADLLRNDTLL